VFSLAPHLSFELPVTHLALTYFFIQIPTMKTLDVLIIVDRLVEVASGDLSGNIYRWN